MNKIQKIVILLIVNILLFPGCSNELAKDIIVIKNVNIIPMDSERILEDHTVIIKDGIILEINTHSKFRYPGNYTVIDGHGKFLMPGLSDMHAHQWRNSEYVMFVANGVTTIRNMWGAESHLINSKDPAQFNYVIPRLYTTSPLIDGNPPVNLGSKVMTDPNEVEEYVRSLSDQGYDYIKVYTRLSEEVYFAFLKASEKYNMPVVGHVPAAVGIKRVLTSGQRSIEHMFDYDLDSELYELTIKNGVWNCPTIVLFTREDKYIDHEKLEGIEYIHYEIRNGWNIMIKERGDLKKAQKIDKERLENRIVMLERMFEMGAKFLIGTDCPNPYIIPGFSVHEELQFFLDAGLSPYEVLKIATYNSADFLEILDTNGTIEIGKETDMILLKENPLENLENLKLLEGVVLRGKWLSKEFLDNELEKIKVSLE